jgi:hypothetical protein
MRPLGHDGAKEEREVHSEPLHEQLSEAWTAYNNNQEALPLEYAFRYAQQLLRSAPPSMASLEDFILRTTITDHSAHRRFGLFVSAGYSLLPVPEIEYTLHTPHLHYFGYGLEKDVVIRGQLGDCAGIAMKGSLTNYGTVGDDMGREMFGSLANHGNAGHHPARRMIGVFLNYGIVKHYAAALMIGTVVNEGQVGQYPFHQTLGRVDDHGSAAWHNFKKRLFLSIHHRRFFHDIQNPRGREFHELYTHLRQQYGAPS